MKVQVIAILLGLLMTVSAGMANTPQAGVGEMQLDYLQWGDRELMIPMHNESASALDVDVSVYILYANHYMSGLERLQVDTSFTLPSGYNDTASVFFELPGSFGRLIIRPLVVWRFDPPLENGPVADSSFKSFSTVFIVKDEGDQYTDRKHSLGPVYSIMDHDQMNFEIPRLMIYLLARGETLDDFNRLFIIDDDYADRILERLRNDGFFPFESEPMKPGVVAIAESEAYGVRDLVKKAAASFTEWYDGGKAAELDKILDKVGIDSYTRGYPSLKMQVLLSLLEDDGGEGASLLPPPQYKHMDEDIRNQNQPKWIVQGGEFFLPRLCLGVFEENGVMHIATFSPDPSLPFDKATIFDMRKAVDENTAPLPVIKAKTMRKIIEKAKKQKLIDGLRDTLAGTLTNIAALIAPYDESQRAYLSDYVYRMILGEYFINHTLTDGGLDCIQVEY